MSVENSTSIPSLLSLTFNTILNNSDEQTLAERIQSVDSSATDEEITLVHQQIIPNVIIQGAQSWIQVAEDYPKSPLAITLAGQTELSMEDCQRISQQMESLLPSNAKTIEFFEADPARVLDLNRQIEDRNLERLFSNLNNPNLKLPTDSSKILDFLEDPQQLTQIRNLLNLNGGFLPPPALDGVTFLPNVKGLYFANAIDQQFYLACFNGDHESLSEVMDKHDQLSSNVLKISIWAAAKNNRIDILKELKEHIEIDGSTKGFCNMIGYENDQIEIIEIFPDVDQHSMFKAKDLMNILLNNNEYYSRMAFHSIFASNVRFNEFNNSISDKAARFGLMTAVVKGHHHHVKMLLEKYSAFLRPEDYDKALELARKYNNETILEIFTKGYSKESLFSQSPKENPIPQPKEKVGKRICVLQ